MQDDWAGELLSALQDFGEVSTLAKCTLEFGEDDIELLPAPHKPPPELPRGKCAIYGFWFNGEWLKIGRVGSNSNALYTTHHYGTNAPSTLFKSIRKDTRMLSNVGSLSDQELGQWIKYNTSRINILISDTFGNRIVSLLETFLHVRLYPRYEGK